MRKRGGREGRPVGERLVLQNDARWSAIQILVPVLAIALRFLSTSLAPNGAVHLVKRACVRAAAMTPAQGSVVGVGVDTDLDLVVDLASHGLISLLSDRPAAVTPHKSRGRTKRKGVLFL